MVTEALNSLKNTRDEALDRGVKSEQEFGMKIIGGVAIIL
jgi:hypothetical protein